MAEQYIKGYLVELSALTAAVGSNDDAFLASLLAHDHAEEVEGLVADCDLDLREVLTEICERRLVPDHAQGYRRALELVVEILGQPIEQWEAIMPGRGWHELGPAWRLWDQPMLASLWGGARSNNASYPWPWTEKDSSREVEWPVAMAVPAEQLSVLRTELEGFNPTVVVERGVPGSIDRFGDPNHWPLEELASDLEYVVDVLRAFIGAAQDAGTDLLLWHDGSQ